MGFCLFGNAALAILHAQAMHRVGRIAIVDWDVHHGNGTQAAFYQRDDVLTISLHQDNLYPANSGGLAERGEGRAPATISTFRCRPARATAPISRPSSRWWRRRCCASGRS